MFCSWKKDSSSLCICAYQLRSPIAEVLNHLCYLGQGTLVLRQQGLSVAKKTPFGLNVASCIDGWNLLRDQVSGLVTDTDMPQNIYLLNDVSDSRPLLAMGAPGKIIDLSIRLDGLSWESSSVTAMLRRFDGISLNCRESRRLGAGAWMDDWGAASARLDDGELVSEAASTLRECDWLEVEINTRMHRNTLRFCPSFIDSEGSVLRVADRSCQHVMYADVEAQDFRLERISASQVRITKAPVAA